MNVKREIKSIKGDPVQMSYPNKGDIDRVRKEKGIDVVKLSDLPNETVQNMLVHCLAAYEVKNKREVFDVNACALWVMNEDKKELPESLKLFLINEVLPQATMRQEIVMTETGPQTQTKGVYNAWSMAQVYEELGVTS